MINRNDLIAKFQEALDNQWGYIWGKTHEMWSDEKQKEYAQKYKDDPDRKLSCEFGGKWAGRWVTDCSGLFAWAFKALGGYMYHGSNTMYKNYCTAKGALINGHRDDNQILVPGTAVFTGNEKSKNHVGLFCGNGMVIEAAGTKQGVIWSNITADKWKYWGELKGVQYQEGADPDPQPAQEGQATVNAKQVALREGPSKSARVIARIDAGETVSFETLPDGWVYVSHNGKKGFMMTDFLQ